MDNGNDPPARIPCLEISDENMIPTNSGLMEIIILQLNKHHARAVDGKQEINLEQPILYYSNALASMGIVRVRASLTYKLNDAWMLQQAPNVALFEKLGFDSFTFFILWLQKYRAHFFSCAACLFILNFKNPSISTGTNFFPRRSHFFKNRYITGITTSTTAKSMQLTDSTDSQQLK